MGIYKRGNTWTVRVCIDGKRYERAIGPEREVAEAVQKEVEAEIALRKAAEFSDAALKILTARNKKTIDDAFADYMRLRESTTKPSTRRTYAENYRAHIQKAFGQRRVITITKYDLADFQNELAARTSATRTNNVMNLMRSILKLCLDDGDIMHNPAASLKRLRQEAPDIDPLTLEELEVAFAHIPKFFLPIFEVLAFTGMRPNELKALRWSDIDWRRNEIKISKGRVKGVESTVKTRGSKRIIPMHPRTRAALELQRGNEIKNIDSYIFTSKRGQPINQHLDRIWAKALKRAGLRHRPCYQLRHTWASMALAAGETPGWVARMLGHTDLETLFRHYARFIPSDRDGRFIASVGFNNSPQWR